MELKEALDLSIKKWEYLVENPCAKELEIISTLPELKDFPAMCALCELYYDGGCKGCPLDDELESRECSYEWDKYAKFAYAVRWKENTFGKTSKQDKKWARKWAQELLDRLERLREEME